MEYGGGGGGGGSGGSGGRDQWTIREGTTTPHVPRALTHKIFSWKGIRRHR